MRQLLPNISVFTFAARIYLNIDLEKSLEQKFEVWTLEVGILMVFSGKAT